MAEMGLRGEPSPDYQVVDVWWTCLFGALVGIRLRLSGWLIVTIQVFMISIYLCGLILPQDTLPGNHNRPMKNPLTLVRSSVT